MHGGDEMGNNSKLATLMVCSLHDYLIPNTETASHEEQRGGTVDWKLISKWKSLKNRRLQNWGGVVHEKGLLPQPLPPWLTKITQRICEETGLFPSPINHVLINEYLPHQGIMPHQDGPAYFPVVAILSLGSPAVMKFSPHSRFGEYNGMATNSSTAVNDTSENAESAENKTGLCSDQHDVSVLLMPCSLLIFKDEAYSDYLHGIEDSNVHQLDKVVNAFEWQEQEGQEGALEVACTDGIKSIKRTSTRVSLTCRLVSKVHKNLFKF
ncbi:hypothetical protein Scep_003070 [Stephania cephalantha]|uniref:Fe2OG dioxygenase domain-containing protein n=1 Tax=Stephania cephalantha TaxID=152367 RepID=A0AAP0KPY8_9MAGN